MPILKNFQFETAFNWIKLTVIVTGIKNEQVNRYIQSPDHNRKLGDSWIEQDNLAK